MARQSLPMLATAVQPPQDGTQAGTFASGGRRRLGAMTLDGWREVVRKTATDPVMAELVAKLLTEQDAAKAELQREGYGCTGMPWLDVVAFIVGLDKGTFDRR